MNRIIAVAALALAFAAGYFLPRADLQGPANADAGARVYRAPTTARSAPVDSPVSPGPAARTAPISPGLKALEEQPDVFSTLYRVYQLAANSDLDTALQLAAETAGHGDPLLRLNATRILLERIAADDPGRALDFAESLPAGSLHDFLVAGVVSGWARTDEDAAFVYFSSIGSLELKRRVAASLLRDTALSPVFHAAVRTELGPYGDELAERIERTRRPAPEVFEEALASRSEADRKALFQSARRWFTQAPEEALARVTTLPDSPERSDLLQMMLQDLAKEDPEQAVALMQAYAADNNALQQTVLARYARENPVEARPYIEAYTRRTGETHPLSQMLASWVREDPHGAITYARDLPDHQREQTMHELTSAYLADAPREALDWMLSLEGQERELTLGSLWQLPGESADAAEAMLEQVGSAADRDQLVRLIAAHKAGRDPETAITWLEQHSDHQNYAELHGNALHRWAATDPAGAAAHLEQRWFEPELSGSFRSMAWSWGRRDPRAALDWAREMPESPGRTAALSALVDMTARRNPEQARALFDTLPEGPDRDRSAASLASQLAGDDPAQMRELMAELGVAEDVIEGYMMVWR